MSRLLPLAAPKRFPLGYQLQPVEVEFIDQPPGFKSTELDLGLSCFLLSKHMFQDALPLPSQSHPCFMCYFFFCSTTDSILLVPDTLKVYSTLVAEQENAKYKKQGLIFHTSNGCSCFSCWDTLNILMTRVEPELCYYTWQGFREPPVWSRDQFCVPADPARTSASAAWGKHLIADLFIFFLCFTVRDGNLQDFFYEQSHDEKWWCSCGSVLALKKTPKKLYTKPFFSRSICIFTPLSTAWLPK